MPDFLLPDLGEGLEEAEVVAWRVKPGDRVAVDQVIAEVETAKAVVEVPVPYAGVVAALHATAGSTVSVGQPLLTVEAEEPAAGFREPGVVVPGQAQVTVNEAAGAAASSAAAAGAATPGVAAAGTGAAGAATLGGAGAGAATPRAAAEDAAEQDSAAGNTRASSEEASGSVLIGYGTSAAPTRSRRGRRRAGGVAVAPPAGAPPARPAGPGAPPPGTPAPPGAGTPELAGQATSESAGPATPESAGPATPVPAANPPAAPDRPRRVAVISPIVRKEARDADLDLTTVTGTGPEGVVSREDVRLAIAGRAMRQEPPAPEAGPETETGERRIPLRGARRAAAEKLSRSRREIPEATVWVDVDATDLVETRRALNTADPKRPVSLLALLARFTILGLRRYPELNARIEGDEIIVPDRVNLGFAAQTDHGLVVPVVPDAHRLTTRDLSARLAERTTAARERRLSPADLAGGTFTVNNYGVFGVDGSAAIINHPEVAILGMGRVIDRPWVVDGQLTVRKVTELTLAFDHRACDGGTAGGFLRYVADCIESPTTALGDM
jgi:pyruvate dehydrogenase E2 component (dihydrolipoamide acetyltransferase)